MRATSGVAVTFNGCLVDWATKRQSAAINNICEAEVYAANLGLRCGQFFRNVLTEVKLLPQYNQRLAILCDNSSAVNIANEGLKKHSKYYFICMLYLKDALDRSEASLAGVASADNLADIFTKFVGHTVFNRMTDLLHLKRLQFKK